MELANKYKFAINALNILSQTWHIKALGNIPSSPSIVAFWHGHMLPVWKYCSRFNPAALVSMSKDGEILSGLLEKWNYKVVRGSSSKGGSEALAQLTGLAKNNMTLITPDGPQGPAKKFKAGAIIASQRSKAPLYLCGIKCEWEKKFSKSWDNFTLPLPFAKILLNFSFYGNINQEYGREKINEIISDAESKLRMINNQN